MENSNKVTQLGFWWKLTSQAAMPYLSFPLFSFPIALSSLDLSTHFKMALSEIKYLVSEKPHSLYIQNCCLFFTKHLFITCQKSRTVVDSQQKSQFYYFCVSLSVFSVISAHLHLLWIQRIPIQ